MKGFLQFHHKNHRVVLNRHILPDIVQTLPGGLCHVVVGLLLFQKLLNRNCLKDKEHIGMSEFVVKGDSDYELDGVYETYDYITSEKPVNLLEKDTNESISKDPTDSYEYIRLKEAS